MENIIEFNDYFVNLNVDSQLKVKIREWLRKYEVFTNIHNSGEFPGTIEDIVSDVMDRFNIPKDKRDGIRNYINELYDLSDGLSVIMSPYPQLVYVNNPDQVQNLYY